MMNVTNHFSLGASQPRQLFVPANQFEFVAFPVPVRFLRMRAVRRSSRYGTLRLAQKGAGPCRRF
jgi:hypothetical protein